MAGKKEEKKGEDDVMVGGLSEKCGVILRYGCIVGGKYIAFWGMGGDGGWLGCVDVMMELRVAGEVDEDFVCVVVAGEGDSRDVEEYLVFCFDGGDDVYDGGFLSLSLLLVY